MDILDDMGVSKLSAKVFLKVNYSFKLYYIHSMKVNLVQNCSENLVFLHFVEES